MSGIASASILLLVESTTALSGLYFTQFDGITTGSKPYKYHALTGDELLGTLVKKFWLRE